MYSCHSSSLLLLLLTEIHRKICITKKTKQKVTWLFLPSNQCFTFPIYTYENLQAKLGLGTGLAVFKLGHGSQDSLLVRALDPCWTGHERLWVQFPAGAATEFSSPELTLCADSYLVSVPPPCYCSGCQRAGSRLHLNTHTPLTQQSRSGLTMPLSRHSVGTYLETSSNTTHLEAFSQSSQFAETDPGIKSGISVHELISTLKKKVQVENEWCKVPKKSSQVRSHHHLAFPGLSQAMLNLAPQNGWAPCPFHHRQSVAWK